jgi:hypothetical protein
VPVEASLCFAEMQDNPAQFFLQCIDKDQIVSRDLITEGTEHQLSLQSNPPDALKAQNISI